MRTTFGIMFAVVAMFVALQLVGYLPAVSRVDDLGEVGSGLELGEWQISVGVLILALVLFSVLTVFSLRVRFPIGFAMVSWLAFLSVAAATGAVYSAEARTGIMNEYGHGLTYGEWWASVIPWTVATALVGLCAISSLIHAMLKRGRQNERNP